MRTHGWQGAPPVDDDEAVARIIEATHRCVEQRGARTTITHVATELGVSRATVYRYYPSTTALLRAAADAGTKDLLRRLADGLREIDDLTEAVVETIVRIVGAVPSEPYLQLLLDEPSHTLLRSATSGAARDIGRTLLVDHTAIDWRRAPIGPDTLDEIVEWGLRIVQSFLSDPGAPARSPEDLRRFLTRWLAPSLRAAYPPPAR